MNMEKQLDVNATLNEYESDNDDNWFSEDSEDIQWHFFVSQREEWEREDIRDVIYTYIFFESM